MFLVRVNITSSPLVKFRTHLLILLLSQVHKDLARRVFDIQKAENRGTIVGHGHVLKMVRII